MKKITIIIMMCIAAMTISAKVTKVDSLSMQISIIEQQIREERRDMSQLQKEVLLNEKALHSAEEHIDRVNEEISNQISASSHTIQVWGWIIAIISILAAFYINRMWQKSKDLTEETKKQLQETENKLQELQSLYSDIQKNSQKIYAALRREETVVLLTRLEEIPEDIVNIATTLLSRELQEEDFPKVLNAYSNLISRSLELNDLSGVSELRMQDEDFRNQEESYALQFAQHFMGESILNPELRDLLRPRFVIFFDECFFRNDAEKSTKDFKKGLDAMEDSQQQMELLKEFISAIVRSHYSRLTELYKILLNNLSEAQLEETWNAVSKDNSNAIHFANTIKETLSSVNPQNPTIKKITTYIEEAEKAETPSSPDASVQA